MITTITLTIHHKKPIRDLADKVAGRAYTLAGVDDVTAAVAGWMPVESAPKDGTEIIVRIESEVPAVFRNGHWWKKNGYDFTVHCFPDHWMPLPSLTKDAE